MAPANPQKNPKNMAIFKRKPTTKNPDPRPLPQRLAESTWKEAKAQEATHQEILMTCAHLIKSVCIQAKVSPSDAQNYIRTLMAPKHAQAPSRKSKRPSTNGL